MSQLRQLLPMSVIEPSLNQNLTACPLFGIGDVLSQQKYVKNKYKIDVLYSVLISSGLKDNILFLALKVVT